MVHLSNQFAEKTSKREYIAMVWGNVKDESGKIERAYEKVSPKTHADEVLKDLT